MVEVVVRKVVQDVDLDRTGRVCVEGVADGKVLGGLKLCHWIGSRGGPIRKRRKDQEGKRKVGRNKRASEIIHVVGRKVPSWYLPTGRVEGE